MESGSEDEFFDAAENISLNRSKTVDSPAVKENARPGKSIFHYPVNTTETVNDDDVAKKSDVITPSCSTKTESGDATINTKINELESEDTKSTKRTSLENKDNETSNEIRLSDSSTTRFPKGTTNIEINDKHVKLNFHKGNGINTMVTTTTKGIPSSPDEPPPVAPPRKKRNPKKPKELILGGNTARLQNKQLPSSCDNDEGVIPHIELNTKSNKKEMNKVLERGNSLDVVLNDDSMSRRSGGTTSPPPVKTPPKESKPEVTGNLYKRTSLPGERLTDAEILDQVIIKNLDTGETIPLSLASEKLPECTNPLTLHILRLATEQNSDTNIPPTMAEQGDEDGHMSDTSTASAGKMQGKRKKLKKFLGRTVQKIKSVADEVSQQVRKGEDESSSDDEQQAEGDDGYIKFKNHRAKKDRLLFNRVKLLQDLSSEQVGHIGAVWTMKFSLCGKLLATAGQDNIVRVWVLKDTVSTFEEMRRKYSHPSGRTSPTGSMTSSNSATSADDDLQAPFSPIASDDNSKDGPFQATPFVMYHGHTSDVLDLSWSKNYFLLSSSMDKTVRLWHISRQECLCCFQHVDFVTAICFHPRDDRYFLSGSLDGKIRLWNIPEKKVALWNEIDGSGTSLVTAANFCQNGKLAVVGTYDGRCIFYDTEKLKYHTQVTVRSSHGKNARGRKISGIEPMPGEDKVLITSNDSRIRLYDLKDHSLYCKYRGVQNESSQIRANFSHDGKLILCGSEDKFVYIWRTHHEVLNVRKDRNDYYESFSAHDAVVTAAIFAPYPHAIVEKPQDDTKVTAGTSTAPSGTKEQSTAATSTVPAGTKEHSQKPYEIIVAADWQGGVKLYINR